MKSIAQKIEECRRKAAVAEARGDEDEAFRWRCEASKLLYAARPAAKKIDDYIVACVDAGDDDEDN